MVCYDEAITKSRKISITTSQRCSSGGNDRFHLIHENNVPFSLDNDNTVKRVREQVRHICYTPAIHDMKRAASIIPRFPTYAITWAISTVSPMTFPSQ